MVLADAIIPSAMRRLIMGILLNSVGFSGSGLLEAGEACSCEFPGKGAYSGYHPYHCGSYVAVALMQFLFGIPCLSSVAMCHVWGKRCRSIPRPMRLAAPNASCHSPLSEVAQLM